MVVVHSQTSPQRKPRLAPRCAAASHSTSVGSRRPAQAHQASASYQLTCTTGCCIGGDGAGSYPPPLVDHPTAWRAARARFAAVRNSPAARLEADAIQQRHGSRKAGMRMTGQGAGRRAGAPGQAPHTAPAPVAQLSLFDNLADPPGGVTS